MTPSFWCSPNCFPHAGVSPEPVVYKAPYVLPWLDSSNDNPEAGVPFEAGKTGESNCHS